MKAPRHLKWVRQQPCCIPSHNQDHFGSVHAHHKTGGGMGMKSSDHETMPLCAWHHSQRHELTGWFKGWTKAALKEWETEESAKWLRKHRSEGYHLGHEEEAG